MSLKTTAQRLLPLRTASPFTKSVHNAAPRHRRPFISLPGSSGPQSLVATRILPYAHEPLYDLIADVDSYASFVPYCSHSSVLQWSDPDSSGRSWPTLADLHISWGGFREVFTSRLQCVPGVSIHASSDSSTLSGARRDASPIFKSLETLWSLKPILHHHHHHHHHHQPSPSPSSPATEVRLSIKFQFTNPLYSVLSAAVTDQMASLMIEAFEKRVHAKLRPRL